MSTPQGFARLAALGAATVGEANPAARLVGGGIRAVTGLAVAGPAFTVRAPPGDNLALHRAIAAAPSGAVLVVDNGGSPGFGAFGEIMALACLMRDIAGLVIDGGVRDTAQMAALGFPVFAREVNIRGTRKDDPGALGQPVTVGGVEIGPGEIVLADADGILVFPAAQLAVTLEAAEQRAAKEAGIMARLRAGETTLAILGLQQEA